MSSTYSDLEVGRKEVMHALLELHCIPAGMELFPATNESQWNSIKKIIDDCDYFILIIAGRYGSIGPDALSYTEMEYRYALDRKIPCIAFLHKDPGLIIARDTESSDEGKAKLKSFRNFASSKLCKHWDTPDSLGSVVSRSMIQLMNSHPAVGWVKADTLSESGAAENLRLRREIDDLKGELAKLSRTPPATAEGLQQGSDPIKLRFTFTATHNSGMHDEGEFSYSTTWDDVFACLSPILIDQANEDDLFGQIRALVERKSIKELGLSDEFSVFGLRDFRLVPDDLLTITVQLRALGLITQIPPKRPGDQRTFWTLTPLGDATMTRTRAIHRTVIPKDVM